MIREREGLYARHNYLHVYAGTKCRGAYGQGGVVVEFYGSIKGHPQDNNIRVIVSEYKVYDLLLASPL